MKQLRQALVRLLPLLPAAARRYLWFFALVSAALTLLDTAALGILALMMTPLITGSSVRLPVLGEVGADAIVWWLLGAALLMIAKSLVSIWLQYRATRRFARFELDIGAQLFHAYIRAPWTERLKRSSTQLAQMSDIGIANVISGVLYPAASLPTEIIGISSVLLILLVSQPLTALITLVYLGGIAFLLFIWISKKAQVAGRVNRDFALKMVTLIAEMVSALKEITLRDKSGEVGEQIQSVRLHVARSRANIRFLQAVPKFVVDMALIGGFLVVGGVAWLANGQQSALAAVAVFSIAGFKIIPGITRAQNFATTINSNIAYTTAVVQDIDDARRYEREAQELGHTPMPASPKLLRLSQVEFTYPGADRRAVQDIDLTVPIGTSVALVGSSGAGKSTLIDLLLGLIVPSHGSIDVDGQPLPEVLADWRSRVGYVPQDVTLFDGTIAQNVALTWSDDVDEARVVEALEQAQLLDVVRSRPGGIHGRVGERGLTLSGGQRQRLGIARALYVKPLVLVLDEATSALDTATEEAVAAAVRDMHGDVTVVSVAHRLSTIRHCDQVCFMKDGTIVSRGSFDEVVRSSPDFAEQARLSGLV
jgi:ABC-type multidrug transport system fused ATPase/permease subunit